MRSIRSRLLVLMLLGLAVVLTLGGVAVYEIAESGLVDRLDEGLRVRARSLAAMVTTADDKVWFDSDDEESTGLQDGMYAVQLAGGEPVLESDRLRGTSFEWNGGPNNPGGALHFGNVRMTSSDGSVIEGRGIAMRFRPRIDDDSGDEDDGDAPIMLSVESDEELTAVVLLSRSSIDRTLAHLFSTLLIVGGVVGVTIIVLVIVGVRWSLAPLDRLQGHLSRISGHTAADPIEPGPGVPRELQPVYRELNNMLSRVQRTLEQERLFADAAAHELRTPLAELHAMAEVALKWPKQNESASMADVLAITCGMERLVEALLLMSRADEKAMNGAVEPVPVCILIDSLLDSKSPQIDQQALNLNVTMDADLKWQANAEALRILLANLVDNAVAYTEKRGSITITSLPDGSLILRNGPVDLEAEDVNHLFEAFWRKDGTGTDRAHAGIGLAVVRRLVDAMKVEVRAELEGNDLQVSVRPSVDSIREQCQGPQ